jgi:hypothetical protein
MWYSFSLFTMMCPFFMGYGSLVSLKIKQIKEKKEGDRRLSCGYVIFLTPFIILYLLGLDIAYMLLTVVVLPLLVILRIVSCGHCDYIHLYDDFIESILEKLFYMNKMDIQGFRR